MKIIIAVILGVLVATSAQAAPIWTDHNDHDPGHRLWRGPAESGDTHAQHNQTDLDFVRRIVSAALSKIEVRGWDPVKKEPVIGFGDGVRGTRVKVKFPWVR